MYIRPRTIDEAVTAMTKVGALAIGGGTDVFPAHVARAITRPVVDITGLSALRGISRQREHVRIGGATTWSDIIAADLPGAFDGLKAAAQEVGSIQIQNRGTIAGNLCNASPAADGVPPLLTLDAEVELLSVRGARVLPLTAFITGYRSTALAADEILSAILVPGAAVAGASAFAKLGARRYLVISILMAAAVIERAADGRIARAAIAIGAASPVAQRLPRLERDLHGLSPETPPSSVLRPHHVEALTPIDDVRATSAYRMEAAMTVAGEALDRAAGVPA